MPISREPEANDNLSGLFYGLVVGSWGWLWLGSGSDSIAPRRIPSARAIPISHSVFSLSPEGRDNPGRRIPDGGVSIF
jgi:hypothetical protein